MRAIITKYLGPTNHRGARVKATAWACSVTVSWDHALSADQNHDKAAGALADKYGWRDDKSRLVGGAMPDGCGFAYVLVSV